MNCEIVAIAPSEPLAISLAMWVSYNKKCRFRLVIDKSAYISSIVLNMLESLGANVEIGSAIKTSLSGAKEVYLHTFAYSDESAQKIVKSCQAENAEIICYADGLKGDYNIKFLKNSESRRILFFGWVFDKGGLEGMHIDVLPLKVIVDKYKIFAAQRVRADLHASDLVVLMRYWGRGAYQFKPEISIAEGMFRSIPLNPEVLPERVYMKSDSRVSSQVKESLFLFFKSKLSAEISDFSALCGVDINADTLPFEMLWTNPTGAMFYCFDSSVAIYLAAIGEENILFPKESSIPELFSDVAGINAAINYSRMYRRVCSSIRNEGIDIPLVFNADSNIHTRRHRMTPQL